MLTYIALFSWMQLLNTGLALKPVPTVASNSVVIMEGLVNTEKHLAPLRVLYGGSPLSDSAISAVEQWTFGPETRVGEAIGVTFLYRGRGLLGTGALTLDLQRAGMPSLIVDPGYPPSSVAEGVVILEVRLDGSGKADRIRVVHAEPSLTEATIQAVREWRFTPVSDPRGATHIIAISFLRAIS